MPKKCLPAGLVLTLTWLLAGCGSGVSGPYAGHSGDGITVTRSSTLTPAPGYVLVSGVHDSNPAFAVDLNGKVVWSYPFDTHSGNYFPVPIQPLPNGHFIVEAATGSGGAVCADCPQNNVIQEVDLGGTVVWQLTNQQLHDELAKAGYKIDIGQMSHDVIGLPNGHLIVLASDLKTVAMTSGDTPVQGAALIDLDQNRQPVWVWDAFDHLDVNRHPYFPLPDWMHGNAVLYSPDDGNLIFSSRAQSWLIKIDYADGKGTGNIIWRLGKDGDFTLLNGGPPDWFYGQHGPIILSPNSTGVFQIGMFDNGNARVMNAYDAECGAADQPACYSTVPIFQVDEVNRTAKVIWRDTLPFFSFALGNMQVLDNGDVWFDAGWVTNGAIVREVTMQTPPQTVLEMDFDANVYRAIHVPGSTLGLQ